MTVLPEAADRRLVSLLWAGTERESIIASIHAQLFDAAWSDADIAKMLDDPGICAFVATVAHPAHVAGFVIGRMAADEGEILSLGVLPEHQHQGIGLMLTEGLMRTFATAGVMQAYLEVAADNVFARALYEKAGFEATGLRKGYYHRDTGPPADAVTMRLKVG